MVPTMMCTSFKDLVNSKMKLFTRNREIHGGREEGESNCVTFKLSLIVKTYLPR